jgi:hypothetical protein
MFVNYEGHLTLAAGRNLGGTNGVGRVARRGRYSLYTDV